MKNKLAAIVFSSCTLIAPLAHAQNTSNLDARVEIEVLGGNIIPPGVVKTALFKFFNDVFI